MLTNLKISNFKCFQLLSLPLAPLTLLTGFNAAGKSTSLQSLLLIAQSLRSGNRSCELPLNGRLTCLGTPGEVVNSGKGDVLFGFDDKEIGIEWILEPEDRSQGIGMKIREIKTRTTEGVTAFNNLNRLESLLPPSAGEGALRMVDRLRDTIFLSAVRQGSADVFPVPDEPSPVHADVGVQGELAPWWFERFNDEEVEEARCNSTDEAKTLRRQFNAWASQLFPGAQGNVQAVERTNLMRLELRIGSLGDWRRPANIGYGLTYAFPVIVAGLLAKKGQILVIDSPEAHLHPLGQSKMGQFLATIAAAGVQVIIETHSDHVLNGIRLAIRDNTIAHENVAVHFFNLANEVVGNIPRVVSPLIDKTGNLSEWPMGFFDQGEKDLARLAGWE